MPWFFHKQPGRPGRMTQLAAVQQLLYAQSLEEVQQAFENEEFRQIFTDRLMLRAFKRFRQMAHAQGDPEIIRRIDTLERIVKNARHYGIDEAIKKEQRDADQFAHAAADVFTAALWDLEGVVRRHLGALSQPRVLEGFYQYDATERAKETAAAKDDIAVRAGQELRTLKIAYVEDAIKHNVDYAEQRFKQRYQAFAAKYHL